MRCGVCLARLVKVGTRKREYRDATNGRIYKVIRWPRYAPCPRLNDPAAHPARHKSKAEGAT